MAFPIIAAALGLAEFVPTIARWLGGDKAHDIAAKVVETAKKVTGKHDPVEAIKAMHENTKLVAEFQKAVMEIEAELELAYIQDRQDARARDVALAEAGRTNVRADVMVVSAALGLIFCLCSLGYYSESMPGEAVGIISTIAGIFGACLKDAYTFEFGSSRGSRVKDAAMAAVLERPEHEGL